MERLKLHPMKLHLKISSINFHQVKAQLQLMLSEHPATDIASGHI
jgi:hypothetical protein